VYDPTIAVDLPTIKLTPLTCPNELEYSLQKQDGSTLESYFNLDDTVGSENVQIYSTAPLMTGLYKLRVVLTDPTTGVTCKIDFSVTIKCSKTINVLMNPLAPLEYNVGSETLISEHLPLPSYIPSPPDCFMGTITFQLVYLNDPLAPFPDFISQFPVGSISVAT
jgi:hypothetical protein